MVEGTSYMFVTGPNVDEDGHARGGDARGARRRLGPLARSRASPTSARRTTRRASRSLKRLLSFLPAEQHGGPAARAGHGRPEPDGGAARLDRPGGPEQAVRHARGDPADRGRRRTSSRSTRTTPRTSSSASPHLGGRVVGIVANQPPVLAGCLDIDAVDEGRALRPLLRLLQHPARHLRGRARLPARHGPGVERDHQARREAALRLLRGHGAEAHRDHAQGLRRRVRRHELQAHPRRPEPRLADRPRSRSWGAKGAVEIIFRKEIAASDDPAAAEAERIEEYRERFANPYIAAERGYIDDVIEPRRTRPRLISALALLETKRDKNPPKKHGNIPL